MFRFRLALILESKLKTTYWSFSVAPLKFTQGIDVATRVPAPPPLSRTPGKKYKLMTGSVTAGLAGCAGRTKTMAAAATIRREIFISAPPRVEFARTQIRAIGESPVNLSFGSHSSTYGVIKTGGRSPSFVQ